MSYVIEKLQAFYGGSIMPYRPNRFLYLMWRFVGKFAQYRQQDAHEFFIALLGVLCPSGRNLLNSLIFMVFYYLRHSFYSLFQNQNRGLKTVNASLRGYSKALFNQICRVRLAGLLFYQLSSLINVVYSTISVLYQQNAKFFPI